MITLAALLKIVREWGKRGREEKRRNRETGNEAKAMIQERNDSDLEPGEELWRSEMRLNNMMVGFVGQPGKVAAPSYSIKH